MQYAFSCMPPVLAGIEGTLSPARLTLYYREAGGDKHKAIRLYVWNARLCEEFYLPLQLTEVALRNAIGQSLLDHFGSDWFENNNFINVLPERHKKELASVVEKKRENRQAQFNGNDVIAGMTFGFWVHLMKRNYAFVTRRQGLRAYFPGLPRDKDREDIYSGMEQMREFRNDIFHHEAIFVRRPKRQYANIQSLLSWICPNTHWFMRQLANPDVVLQRKPQV